MFSRLTVTPQITAIAAGQTVRFKATGARKVIWSAVGGTIDADGDFDAPYGAQSMTATVIATSKDDSTLSDSATVHVLAPGQVTGTANA
jgi:hypothetical protein